MEIDVEREEVEEVEVEILGRGIVGVGDQPLRIDLLGDVVELFEEVARPRRAVPRSAPGVRR
jgi:hypothetical protein